MTDNNFFVNNMTRAYSGYLQSRLAGTKTKGVMGFKEVADAVSFGATKEEYRGESWYTGFQGGRGRAPYEKEAEESFWEKRRKRHKQYIQEQQEMANEKKIMQRVYQEAAVRRGDYENMFDGQSITPMLSMAKIMLNAAKKVK